MIKDAITSIYGENVFNDAAMQKYLPSIVYNKLKETINDGADLDVSLANTIAHGMKVWAIERGATHFTHWFQPMTGITAEKHESFINPVGNGKILMEFSGKELVMGESDASSFPSGGLRATFEARGYTAWDCTSPAFLRKESGGCVLCIPTVFYSYNGQTLDKKTPLLRSNEALDIQVKRILKIFGDTTTKHISCKVGPEQEYFLIGRDDFLKRDDLRFTGRTLFGVLPPKGQEMDDHYYGTINETVYGFMCEINKELWKLGVNIKTEHNEVAPAQHENVTVYDDVNITVDHNQLVMDVMKKVAKKRGLECLLHEKPFAGINGSGKHNNWSIATDTGRNLLEPGKTPHDNAQFLLFVAAILEAIDNHASLLRLMASNPGNDHRLGANEAPPAVVSVFLGEQLEDIVDQIVETGEAKSSRTRNKLNIGVHTLPNIPGDVTDRNRTSPIAFTGNKFEIRMVASSISIADINTALNTAVAESLCDIADYLENINDLNRGIKKILRKLFTEHQKIIFNGNGYADEWLVEAQKRGLPNTKSYVDAIPTLSENKTQTMFEKFHVLSDVELKSRAEISYEFYVKAINIEAKTMLDMVNKQYMPSVGKYASKLANSISQIKAADSNLKYGSLMAKLVKVCDFLDEVDKKRHNLSKVLNNSNELNVIDKANYFKDKVILAMNELRKPVDALEVLVPKDYWPVPSYTDMLYAF